MEESKYQEIKEKKKWWQHRKVTRKEYGDTAALGILISVIGNLFIPKGTGLGIILGMLTDILGTAGMISGIIWIVLTIKEKRQKNRLTKKETISKEEPKVEVDTTEMNYCPKCGLELMKESSFCSKCGYKIK